MPAKSINKPPTQDLDRLLPSFSEGNKFDQLDWKQRENLLCIDETLLRHWQLGRQIMLSWCPSINGIDVIAVPYYLAGSLLMPGPEYAETDENNKDKENTSILINLIRGSRYIDSAMINKIVMEYGVSRLHIDLPHSITDHPIAKHLIDGIVKRYSISFAENSAVALFDIVNFSLYKPFEQMTLLNSLAYSINSAHSKFRDRDITVDFASSTTGDGFYIWNKESSIRGNINIYQLMQIVLADNAIARMKSHGHTAPSLKTAIHVGSYYEFYRTESLYPTKYNYIVGDVTIELARMIELCLPGQIVIGDFNCQIPAYRDKEAGLINVNTRSFIELLQENLDSLLGLEISDVGIKSIKCYLTGKKQDGYYMISRYKFTDKHNLTRCVYNAKVNIYRENGEPIFLGIQDHNVHGPGITRME